MKGYDIGNNAAVIKMATLHITGNVIDLKWFKHLKLESKKPDSLAILLLGDIVYWYRPIEVRDEETGLVTGYRKKFAADKLQRSYGAFAEAYGYTKDQVKDALKRLEDAKVIDLDFRHPTINGQKLGNVLYIGLNVDRLAEISSPLSPLKVIGSKEETPHPPAFKDDTNTETTTETTTEIIINNVALDLFKSNFGKFNSQKELERWLILFDSVGDTRAQELIEWATKKEIHLENRRSLLDSIETAAKKWREPRRNGNRPPREADKQAGGGTYEFCAECGAIPCQCEAMPAMEEG
jgi:uncharacterized protein YjbJ (UPF0337 family)